jgi:hypothetical protein
MGAFFTRLLAVERRLERYRRTILAMQVRMTALEQQLNQLRGNV